MSRRMSETFFYTIFGTQYSSFHPGHDKDNPSLDRGSARDTVHSRDYPESIICYDGLYLVKNYTFQGRYVMKRGKRLELIWVLLLTMSIGLTGCATHDVEVSQPVDLPERFSNSGGDTVPDRWWREFDDPALNELVSEALDNNFSLKQAWNRLAEARALIVQAEADLFPTLDVTASGDIRDQDNNNVDETTETTQLEGVARYEVDLWGRIESAVEATEFAERARRTDVRAAAISLSAEVARTWYQLVEQYAQLTVIEEQIRTNDQLYRILQNRYKFGRSRAADVLRQERLLVSTREQKSAVQSRIGVLENALAVLVGKPPQDTVNPHKERFPKIPSIPNTGLPGQLVNRRPDVRSAFFEMKQADRRVAEAVANQYPRLELTASASTTGGDEAELFNNWLRTIAADLAIPLLDANDREAQVAQQKAVLARKLNEYGEAVLESFQEVEDALIQEQKQREQLRSTEKQLNLANRTVSLLRQQYINGTADFLDVIDSLRNEQRLERDLLSARRETVEFRIGLYRSLAGGFDTPRPDRMEKLNVSSFPESVTPRALFKKGDK